MRIYTKQECADLLGITYSRVKALQEEIKQLPNSQKYFEEVRNGYSVNEAGLQQLQAMLREADEQTVSSNSQQTVSKQSLDSLRAELEAVHAAEIERLRQDHKQQITQLQADHAKQLLNSQKEHSEQLTAMNEELLEQMNRLTLITVKQLQPDNKPRLLERIKNRLGRGKTE